MHAEASSYTHKTRTTCRRRVGLLFCLFALMAALLGHVEPPAVASASSDHTAVAHDHDCMHSNEQGALAALDCIDHDQCCDSQCSVQATLPVAPAVDPYASGGVMFASFDQLLGDRLNPPLPRPPTVSETL